MGRRARTKEDAINRCVHFLLDQNHTINGTKRSFQELDPKSKIFVIKRHLEKTPRICKLIATFQINNPEFNETTIKTATTIILTHIIKN